MTTTTCTATGCAHPAPDAYLCRDCTDDLAATLNTVPWLLEQLATTLARQDRIGAHAGALEADLDPLPLRWAAVQAATTLTLTLRPWARTIADTRHLNAPATDTPLALAAWLADHLDALRQTPDAADAHDELTYAIGVTRRAIDRQPRLFYAAPCDQCGTDLYATADDHGRPLSAILECRHCGTRYDATLRREWLLTRVEDRLATATEIAAAVPAIFGAPINVHTIRVWITRGRLIPRGWLHTGHIYPTRQTRGDRPLVRIGDVLDLAAQARDRAS